MMRLAGRKALVTGASSGVGLACAKDLAAKGATVIAEQRTKADGFASIKADFSDTAVPEQAIADVIKEHGQIEILINNVGLMREASTDETSLEDWTQTLTVNLIDTDLNIDFIEAQENPKRFRQEIGEIHPLHKTGTPEEGAKLVSWLASDEASFVTGQTYTIDGGRTSQLSLP